MNEHHFGTAYGVGVGPGDPELMTLKACRMIRENSCIAVPVLNEEDAPEESAAYRIAVKAVPELAEKEVTALCMPMAEDSAELARCHRRAADSIESILREGGNLVYLTLGDPCIYCSFTYLQEILERDGFRTSLVNAVTSFCAAASALNVPIAAGGEDIHIIAGGNGGKERPVSRVYMKAGKRAGRIRDDCRSAGLDVSAVERCGMEGMRVMRNAGEIPESTDYFTIILARQPEKGK